MQTVTTMFTRWLQLRFDGRSTAYQRSLRSQWRNTGRWSASLSHADQFIYLCRSGAARWWYTSSNGRTRSICRRVGVEWHGRRIAVESKTIRSCNHCLGVNDSGRDWQGDYNESAEDYHAHDLQRQTHGTTGSHHSSSEGPPLATGSAPCRL